MQRHRITHRETGSILYEGFFPDVRTCAEQAVREGVCLDYADLSRANLVNACLDEASLRQACLRGANLGGANLSEARLDRADFMDAEMQNACLCFSSLRHCHFTGVSFGATDIAGADLSFSHFSTLTALTLNFRDAEMLTGCIYEDGGTNIPFSTAPLVIQGLYHPVAFFDCHVKIGPLVQSYDELLLYTNDNQPHRRMGEGTAYVFIRRYRHMLRALVESLTAGISKDGTGSPGFFIDITMNKL